MNLYKNIRNVNLETACGLMLQLLAQDSKFDSMDEDDIPSALQDMANDYVAEFISNAFDTQFTYKNKTIKELLDILRTAYTK